MKLNNFIKCILLLSIIVIIIYYQSTSTFSIEGFVDEKSSRKHSYNDDNKHEFTCEGDPSTYTCAGENSGWPNCQGIPYTTGGFGITSDPCLTFPDGDVQEDSQYDEDNGYPSYGKNPYFKDKSSFIPAKDNLGNPLKNPTNWYTGRGLIQLTWSCNYMKTQRSLYFLREGLSSKAAQKQIQKNWPKIANSVTHDLQKVSICRNPDIVCGNYKTNKTTPTVTYSDSIVDQAIPWLTCIIYWCEIINTKSSWGKNFDYLTALAGIGPSGGANSPKRIAFSVLYAYMMGLTENDFQIQKGASSGSNGISNICLKKTNKKGCSGGSSSGSSGTSCPGWKKSAAGNIKCSQCAENSCASIIDPTGVCSDCWGDIRCIDDNDSTVTRSCSGGSSDPGKKSNLPFPKDPMSVAKFIMDLKTPPIKASSCFDKHYIKDIMTPTQKKFICAGNDLVKKTSDIQNWEHNYKTTWPSNDAMYMTYAINCKMNQAGAESGPLYSVGNPFATKASQQQINPMYTWEGLAFAAYLWNLGAKNSKILSQYGGFCGSSNIVENKLTLAIFLGNAIVESANFMVCNESTVATGESSSGKPTECNVYSQMPGFPGRYFNNCDDAEPCTYSCCKKGQKACDGSGGGGGGGGGGGQYPQCKPTQDAIKAGYNICSYRNSVLCNKAEPNGKHLCKWDGSSPPAPASNKYSCNNGTCISDPTGKYSTLKACKKRCKSPKPHPHPHPQPTPSGRGNCGSCSKGTCAGQGAWAGQCLQTTEAECNAYDSSQYQWCGE